MRHIKYASKLTTITERSPASARQSKDSYDTELTTLSSSLRVKDDDCPATSSNDGRDESVLTSAQNDVGTSTKTGHVVLEPLRQRPDMPTKGKPSSSPASKATLKYGRNILHEAVRKGDIMAVQSIIKAQPELMRQSDSRGNQALHYAANAMTGNADRILYYLLKAGAFVNAVNDRKQTPLLIHVISNKDDNDLITRLLLHHNAKPMIKVTDTMLLSHFASSKRLHNVAAALCEYM